MSENIYHTPIILKLARKLNIDLATIKGSGFQGKIRKVDLIGSAKFKVTSSQVQTNSKVYLTPLIKKYASIKGIDLANVNGSGIEGRIRRIDIDKHQGTSPQRLTPKVVPTSLPVIEFDLRKDLNTMAQLSTTIDIDFTNILMQDRKSATDAEKVVPIAHLIQAVIQNLKLMPIINAYLTDDATQIQFRSDLHFSFEDELVNYKNNCVIENAENYNLLGISRIVHNFRKEPPPAAVEPTFGIQDFSNTEILFSTPIVKSPTSAMISLGKIQKRATSMSNPEGSAAIAIRSIAFVTLSYDHRIIDGADAARFLGSVKASMESI
jgi:2-oxoglutarate dehydrogenase E2 component (dihydrolipoamide succinyltransferase)